MDTSRVGTSGEENTLGAYRLIAVLGRGGMAVVHLAVMRGPAGFNKLVVLKELHPQYAEDPDVVAMFLDEARLAARLSHPNVVQTNEVGEDRERRFMAMEYLEGQPLNRVLNRLSCAGGLPLAMQLRVIADLLGGLHYAHELGDYDGSPLCIVHRDINPQNVFVTYDGIVKIVDFGIAKARGSVVKTRFGVVKGKLSYMAPEQARCEPVDRRADIFSVGVMLWQAATGTRPWKGVTDGALLENLVRGEFPSVRAAAPEIPEQLERIIVKALAPNREDRHATAAELQADLEQYLAATGARIHARDVGKLISGHFAVDRAAIHAAVEAQLRNHDGAAASLSPLDPPTVPDVGHKPSRKELSPRGEPANVASSTPPPRFSNVPAAPSRERRRRRDLRAWAGAVGVAVLCGGLGLWLHEAPRASTIARVSPQRPATSAEARLVVDEPPADSPVEDELTREEAARRIGAEGPGFASRTESVTLDQDLSANGAPGAASTEPRARPSSSATHAGRKRRRLDATNPYADP